MMDLRDYELAKFQLAEVLRIIADSAPSADGSMNASIQELFKRLAEDRFNLAVVGRFNRGKTSLMNAIMGLDRLPTGMVPLTSVITRVVYGSREQVQVQFERGGLPLEIPMERLPDYVTQRGNPANTLGIAEAHIELPAEILRRGFHFVDTPGLGSVIGANTRTTEAFLPQADAVLLVSGYDSPLTDDELRLARFLGTENRRVFLILNKQDLVPEEARAGVMDYVRGQLVQAGMDRPPAVFSVSAREGLTAKLIADPQLLRASGLARLEQALVRFLIEDKNAAFLLGLGDRLATLLGTVEREDLRDDLCGRILAVQQGIDPRRGTVAGITGAADTADTAGTAVVAGQAVPAVAARASECSVCAQVLEQWFAFLRGYQHDLSVDADARDRLAGRGGLCAQHLWIYASMASERDLCVALTPLLQRLTSDLDGTGQLSGSVAGAARWRAWPQCALCEIQQAVETAAFAAYEARVARAGEHDRQHDGLPSICLPHLRLMATGGVESPALRALAQQQAAATGRLAEDAQRYVLKRDALRHGLASEEEGHAARLACMFVAGHPKVVPRASP